MSNVQCDRRVKKHTWSTNSGEHVAWEEFVELACEYEKAIDGLVALCEDHDGDYNRLQATQSNHSANYTELQRENRSLTEELEKQTGYSFEKQKQVEELERELKDTNTSLHNREVEVEHIKCRLAQFEYDASHVYLASDMSRAWQEGFRASSEPPTNPYNREREV